MMIAFTFPLVSRLCWVLVPRPPFYNPPSSVFPQLTLTPVIAHGSRVSLGYSATCSVVTEDLCAIIVLKDTA